MSKPTILLIPGSFSLPDPYDPVVDAVRAGGYEIRVLHLPSVGISAGHGREGAPPSMYDDAAFVAKEAEKLADEGKKIILIGHSYGGIPVTQGAEGLAVKGRQTQGKAGGIVTLAYMTALVPGVGQSAVDIIADVPQEHQVDLKVDENGWMYHDPPSATAAIIMPKIPLEESEAVVKGFAKHSSVSFTDKLTYAGYKHIPVSYLFCEEDICIPTKIQQAEIDMIEKESGTKVHVTRISADHCPNLTAKQQTIDWILDTARRSQNSQAEA
ncbi:uncharacterized protein Z518_11142 [Rhinocladiella mackenziei CBS 650.93]|uniref:AB hydrolase-1 domain-containing protein n=1 Tax=Rhinocladiella mackenziei CBS 650.93 TaxID=1442369 RepID=A0A0D2ISI4_9EURO|nr:uncharacterized protein Z518_11142 [Rhinocladiella mackenziei CBS 650.93]KIW99729.1 hypothetical protein Z518_11142 [Rhinocladiella mackenziei CBS 650.93]